MATEIAAPWAEPAPITADQLLALADDSWRYELVEGRLLRMPPTGFQHADVEAELVSILRGFARDAGLGSVIGGEPGFLLSRRDQPDTVLAPDVAFIRADRVPPPGSPQSRGFPRLCPDLVVEIGSPSQGRVELGAKASLWLTFGARLVWIVWPEQAEIDVWRPADDPVPQTLTADAVLDGDEVLPGFSYPLSRLFS